MEKAAYCFVSVHNKAHVVSIIIECHVILAVVFTLRERISGFSEITPETFKCLQA